MTDYLHIDTDRTRDAAHHLRSMERSGDDLTADIRRATALAALVDVATPNLMIVADAIADLARILDHRADAADSGGVLPYRAPARSALDISTALLRQTPPTPSELFPPPPRPSPPIDAADTGAADSGASHVDDDPTSFGPLWPFIEPVIDQPRPDPWWPASGPTFDHVQETADHVRAILDDLVPDSGWGPADRFADRLVASVTDPRVLAASAIVPPALMLETISYYGTVSAVASTPLGTYGVGRSNAGGRENTGVVTDFGMSWSVPNVSMMFSPSSSPPESSSSVGAAACYGVCVGADVGDQGFAPSVGVGSPGASAGLNVWQWSDGGPSRAD